MKHKIGIIGSGQVARVLAGGFSAKGHTVMIGSRDEDKLNEWKEKSQIEIRTGSFEDTAAFGDLIVLAVKGDAAESVIKSVADKIKGKIVMDSTNPIADLPPDNGVLRFFTSVNESLMEKLQEAASEAKIC